MSKIPITVRLPDDLANDLRMIAEKRGIAFNAVVTLFLREAATQWVAEQAKHENASSMLADLPAA